MAGVIVICFNSTKIMKIECDLEVGKWAHVCCVLDRTSRHMSLYVQGLEKEKLSSESSSPLIISNLENIVVGGTNAYSIKDKSKTVGILDEMTCYSFPLSQSQVGC